MSRANTIQSLIDQGENSSVEFKSSAVRPESLAREIVAFSNSSGGTILIGVDDDGQVTGIKDRENIEEWVTNVVRNNIIFATSDFSIASCLDKTVICFNILDVSFNSLVSFIPSISLFVSCIG